jgi:hypothetical protein
MARTKDRTVSKTGGTVSNPLGIQVPTLLSSEAAMDGQARKRRLIDIEDTSCAIAEEEEEAVASL